MVTPQVTHRATPATATKPQGRVVDWEAMEPDWRAGIVSKQELASRYGVSRAAIDKHWAKAGIGRDLTSRINAKADSLVASGAVARFGVKPSEVQIVDANGAMVASVRMGHRKSIARGHALCEALMAELEAQTFDKVLMEQLATLMRKPDDEGHDRLNEIYRKVISMPGRVDTAKKLIETMKSVVSMEREAYGIDALPVANPTDSLTAFLMGMKRSALPVVQEVGRDEHL